MLAISRWINWQFVPECRWSGYRQRGLAGDELWDWHFRFWRQILESGKYGWLAVESGLDLRRVSTEIWARYPKVCRKDVGHL